MNYMNTLIGSKLKEIRASRALSLDDAAQLTGVSKAMLGQIERGQSSPTISTLWKIATGLKVSFSQFMNERQENWQVLDRAEIPPVIEENQKMRLYPLFPFDPIRGFEIFTIELEPGCRHQSEPHNAGVEEYILVTEGQIEISLFERKFALKKGNAMRFMANQPHGYRNPGAGLAVFQNIIHYSK